MAKISFELIAEALTENEVDNSLIAKVMKDIERLAKMEAEEAKADRDPPVKKQSVIIISDPRGTLPAEDYVGWVAQIAEDEDIGTTMERLMKASYEFNLSKKGRRYPVKSIGEACEAVPAKFQKEFGISIKTKMPVTVLRTDNVLPESEEDFGAI